MFLRVSRVCWRQLLQFSPPRITFRNMCVTLALCLVSLLAFSEGFFMPASLRKQAPQTAFGSPHWVPAPTIGNNNGANTIPAGYGNPKDFSTYSQQQQQQQQQQQPQTLQHQQQQPQPQSIQPQTAYSSHQYSVQPNVPKYEPTPFQSINQPQYVYEGVYQAPLNSYSQSVQLVPCLCPVNREVLEQQAQQLQQQQASYSATPTSSPFPAENNNNNNAAAAPPTQQTQKRTAIDKTGTPPQVPNVN